MERFGQWLHRVRRAQDMTLDTLAKKTRSHKGYYSGIELGKTPPPSAKMVRKIAEVFNEDPKTLLLMSWVEKAPKELRPCLEQDYDILWAQLIGRRR
jgi:transcriptional regulator with XRE-family HTH domain